jgi:diketogulonate reductase-like aldo/keto reductase
MIATPLRLICLIASKTYLTTHERTEPDRSLCCSGSLRRLQAEQLAIGQLHWSAAKYAPLQELAMVNGIADCYDQGLVREVGVSNYGAKQLRKVRNACASLVLQCRA